MRARPEFDGGACGLSARASVCRKEIGQAIIVSRFDFDAFAQAHQQRGQHGLRQRLPVATAPTPRLASKTSSDLLSATDYSIPAAFRRRLAPPANWPRRSAAPKSSARIPPPHPRSTVRDIPVQSFPSPRCLRACPRWDRRSRWSRGTSFAHAVQSAGIGKQRQLNGPHLLGRVCPGVVTVTVPSLPTVTEVALGGTVMAGVNGLPSAVTTLPCASSWNAPLRV